MAAARDALRHMTRQVERQARAIDALHKRLAAAELAPAPSAEATTSTTTPSTEATTSTTTATSATADLSPRVVVSRTIVRAVKFYSLVYVGIYAAPPKTDNDDTDDDALFGRVDDECIDDEHHAPGCRATTSVSACGVCVVPDAAPLSSRCDAPDSTPSTPPIDFRRAVAVAIDRVRRTNTRRDATTMTTMATTVPNTQRRR